MFRNSGKKIMAFAGFLFWVSLVLVCLLVTGATIYAGAKGNLELTLMTALGGVVAGVVFLLLSYWLTLCLYSYGELVQTNCEIRDLMLRQQSVLERPGRPLPSKAPAAPAPKAQDPRKPSDVELFDWTNPDPTPLKDRQSKLAYDYKAPAGAPAASLTPNGPQPPLAGDKIRCPKCGAKHDPTAEVCRYCATALH